jgi:hypothetical protein
VRLRPGTSFPGITLDLAKAADYGARTLPMADDRYRLRLSIGVLFLAVHVLGACDSTKILSMEQTNTLLNGPIQIGMSREDIIKQLGQPFREERHGTTEFLFYQTVWQVAEKAATRSPC